MSVNSPGIATQLVEVVVAVSPRETIAYRVVPAGTKVAGATDAASV
jgi:hypothetical protein